MMETGKDPYDMAEYSQDPDVGQEEKSMPKPKKKVTVRMDREY